jgi:hypothetical protein
MKQLLIFALLSAMLAACCKSSPTTATTVSVPMLQHIQHGNGPDVQAEDHTEMQPIHRRDAGKQLPSKNFKLINVEQEQFIEIFDKHQYYHDGYDEKMHYIISAYDDIVYTIHTTVISVEDMKRIISDKNEKYRTSRLRVYPQIVRTKEFDTWYQQLDLTEIADK